MSREIDADVIIAGAGPSGLMVGCETALAGVRTIVLEKRSGPHLTRAGTLAPRVLEIFDSRGIIDAIMKRAYELHDDPRTFDGIWAGLEGIDYTKLDSDYPFIMMFPQIETEQILANHYKDLGGELRINSEVVAVEQDSEGVTVTYRSSEGEEQSLRARYLVGADGGRSAVRRSVGIASNGYPATRTAVNVDAFVDNPYPTNLTVAHSENGWAMTYPLRNGLTRFALIDAETCADETVETPDLETAKAMLRRVHGTDFGIEKVNAISTFRDALYMADVIRKDRVFLVGESVRVHYPASGVGMQFCLQDAFNLGWKLGYALRYKLSDEFLDSYSEERLPQINRLISNVKSQCAVQFNFDHEHVALKKRLEAEFLTLPAVNLMICEELAGLSVRYGEAEGWHPEIGRRMPNLTLKGDEGSVFKLLRSQNYVLLDLTGTLDSLSLSDVPVSFAALAQASGAAFAGLSSVLLRPDGHIAWVGTQRLDQSDIQKILNELLPEGLSGNSLVKDLARA